MSMIRGKGMLQAASDHIPNDIIVCILTYLPVKSLLRFKTVSKSWNAIITNPCFVREHHSRQPSSKLLMMKRREKEETDHGTPIFPMPLSFDTKLCAHRNVYQSVKSYLSDEYSDMVIMGPCFGVYCFLVCNYREPSVKIELCNIATGETKVCRPYLNFGEDGVIFCAFGFGCVHNDIISVPKFKVVKLAYYVEGSSLKCSTQVYTSTTDSWKSAESCESFTYEKGIEVNGVIHWQANSLKPIGKKFILTFDLQKEFFGRIERPQGTYSALLTKQDQYLSLITTSNDFVDVWVMHVRGSWVRQATVGPLRVSKTSFLGYWCSDCFGKLIVWRRIMLRLSWLSVIIITSFVFHFPIWRLRTT